MAKIYLSIGINNPPTGAENMVQADAYTLFPDDFMQSYTKHRNIVNFMEAIGSGFSEPEPHKLNNGKPCAKLLWPTMRIKRISDYKGASI